MTPLLCDVWWGATADSFSKTTTWARGRRARTSRATARPTMPPPITATSASTVKPSTVEVEDLHAEMLVRRVVYVAPSLERALRHHRRYRRVAHVVPDRHPTSDAPLAVAALEPVEIPAEEQLEDLLAVLFQRVAGPHVGLRMGDLAGPVPLEERVTHEVHGEEPAAAMHVLHDVVCVVDAQPGARTVEVEGVFEVDRGHHLGVGPVHAARVGEDHPPDRPFVQQLLEGNGVDGPLFGLRHGGLRPGMERGAMVPDGTDGVRGGQGHVPATGTITGSGDSAWADPARCPRWRGTRCPADGTWAADRRRRSHEPAWRRRRPPARTRSARHTVVAPLWFRCRRSRGRRVGNRSTRWCEPSGKLPSDRRRRPDRRPSVVRGQPGTAVAWGRDRRRSNRPPRPGGRGCARADRPRGSTSGGASRASAGR